MGDQSDRDYIELFNELLRAYNLHAPQVNPDRFCSIRKLLGCDEFTALFILGTQVMPGLSLVPNRRMPERFLHDSFLVSDIPCDFATVADLAERYMATAEGVRDLFNAGSAHSYNMWLSKLISCLEHTMMRMLIRDVSSVVRDEGMGINEARAVKVRTADMAEDEARWICVGQRVRARRWASDEPMEGEVISIAPADGVAVVRLFEAEYYLGVSQGLFKVGLLEPVDSMVPNVRREPPERGGRSRPQYSVVGFHKRLERDAPRDQQVFDAIIQGFYPDWLFPIPDYKRLQAIRMDTECDSEVAFFVLGTQMRDREALVVNRTKPRSEQACAFALPELPKDVLSILELSCYFMREPEELRPALLACSFDLASDAGRALVEDLRTKRELMRGHGIVGLWRWSDMGPNEARGVGLTDDEVLLARGDTNIFDTDTRLIVGNRARVTRGEFSGFEGTISSLAPIDGVVGIMPDGEGVRSIWEDESAFAVMVPMQDVEPLD